jgi:hypothetical protein
LQAILPTEWPRDSNRDLRTVTWPIHRQNYRYITDGYIDKMWPSGTPSVKANISPRSQLSPPKLQTTTHPPKNILIFSTQVIFLVLLYMVTTSVL